jgi:type VI secretion system protein ImpC
MSKPISFGELDYKIVASMEESKGMPDPETPFRILILGDFSGRENRRSFELEDALAGRRPVEIDRDNLDEVMAKLSPEISLPLDDKDMHTVIIGFKELDDFHPDRLYERLEIFQGLRNTKKLFDDPRTYEKAAQIIRSEVGTDTQSGSLEPADHKNITAIEPVNVHATDLLDQVIEESEGQPKTDRSSPDAAEWNAFLREIVKAHLVPHDDPEQIELAATVDAASAGLMDTILHHPDFQAIEAAWRAVHFLVSRIETDIRLKLFLLDISKTELSADLTSTEDLRSTGMHKILVEQAVETFGGQPWAVLAGNYTFDQTRKDAELLGRMAKIAKQAGAPFIAAAHSHLLGCESLVESPEPDNWKRQADAEDGRAWGTLRSLPEASYLGLALPGFLLRLPYGVDSDPIEYLEFEEMPKAPAHSHYLWGNPCHACAYLLALGFSKYGWELRPGAIQDIEGLPMHFCQEEGEARIKPCAEVMLIERTAEIMLEKGLMPLISFKDQDKVRLARFQSLADPAAHLAGRWS